MNITDHAARIFKQLTPTHVAYAADPARGEYRGFVALHDLMDANTLLPDCENWNGTDEQIAWSEAIMDKLTEMILAADGDPVLSLLCEMAHHLQEARDEVRVEHKLALLDGGIAAELLDRARVLLGD
jgi:hypothetical protein